jgi:hypothetical protein
MAFHPVGPALEPPIERISFPGIPPACVGVTAELQQFQGLKLLIAEGKEDAKATI